MAEPLVRDLRKQLADSAARWTVSAALRDDQPLPRYTTGANLEDLPRAATIPELDFRRLLAVTPSNPWLAERRVATKILPRGKRPGEPGFSPIPLPEPPAAGAGPAVSVDWRNRWNWPWITSIRDQNVCQACWVFGAVALVEAMVRIEHFVWPKLSEGDVHKGLGAVCSQKGNPSTALNWIYSHGVADPGCFPWNTANVAYTPSTDRNGRTVHIPQQTNLGNIADQKMWIDNVGPLVCAMQVWTDFMSLGSGVYHKQAMLAPGVPNQKEGGHIMLIVGYDDIQKCWIVKNSWATTWGQSGFGLIGYGEVEIDDWAKIGLQNTDPDPWTRRRYHNGNLLESGRGATHMNFEMLAVDSCKVQHWSRGNVAASLPWQPSQVFATDAAIVPTLISTTYSRNLECVYRTPAHRLHHWYLDVKVGNWSDGGVFGPPDADGAPGFIQSDYGAPGNFEVVVRTADSRLNHWWRDAGGTGWHDGGRFGSQITQSGASLIQSHRGNKGRFELVCTLQSGQMQHWWRDNDEGTGWQAGPTFGDNVHSSPCMIEASFGQTDENALGNFELCVAAGNKVEHWWRSAADGQWRKSATFGSDVEEVVGLLQGSYTFNLEVIVRRTDKRLQHYWRTAGIWYPGVIIV